MHNNETPDPRHSTGCRPMTALFASVCMMYMPRNDEDPMTLWKTDATTTSMGTFFTTYLTG